MEANIAGTKHDLLADEPYRLRLLGFHCLHVNVTKMHLRWVFTVETAVTLLKNIFEFTFNKAGSF